MITKKQLFSLFVYAIMFKHSAAQNSTVCFDKNFQLYTSPDGDNQFAVSQDLGNLSREFESMVKQCGLNFDEATPAQFCGESTQLFSYGEEMIPHILYRNAQEGIRMISSEQEGTTYDCAVKFSDHYVHEVNMNDWFVIGLIIAVITSPITLPLIALGVGALFVIGVALFTCLASILRCLSGMTQLLFGCLSDEVDLVKQPNLLDVENGTSTSSNLFGNCCPNTVSGYQEVHGDNNDSNDTVDNLDGNQSYQNSMNP